MFCYTGKVITELHCAFCSHSKYFLDGYNEDKFVQCNNFFFLEFPKVFKYFTFAENINSIFVQDA